MRKSFVTFLFFFVLVFFATNFVLANELTVVDDFESFSPGAINGQGGWAVTNYDANPNNTVNVDTTNPGEGIKNVEIINKDSLIVTRDVVPTNAGVFQFRMRHNKSGLFYLHALTSDAGGQLLFSIQFTESKGILLEEGGEQVTILPSYNTEQWYLFNIDLDNSRGERGTFKIKIDDGSYSEYPYVNSESAVFDFAQMVFGSESNGETSVSAFDGAPKVPVVASTTPASIDIIDDGVSNPEDQIPATTSTPESVSEETFVDTVKDFFFGTTSESEISTSSEETLINDQNQTSTTTDESIDLISY